MCDTGKVKPGEDPNPLNVYGPHYISVSINQAPPRPLHPGTWSREREFFIVNLLVRVHFIIVMIRRTGLAPWEFEFPFPGSLTSTFLTSTPLSTDHVVPRRAQHAQRHAGLERAPPTLNPKP